MIATAFQVLNKKIILKIILYIFARSHPRTVELRFLYKGGKEDSEKNGKKRKHIPKDIFL